MISLICYFLLHRTQANLIWAPIIALEFRFLFCHVFCSFGIKCLFKMKNRLSRAITFSRPTHRMSNLILRCVVLHQLPLLTAFAVLPLVSGAMVWRIFSKHPMIPSAFRFFIIQKPFFCLFWICFLYKNKWNEKKSPILLFAFWWNSCFLCVKNYMICEIRNLN